MPKTMKREIVCLALAIVCASVPDLRAQNQKELLPAPLPSQIFTPGGSLFSNAGETPLMNIAGDPTGRTTSCMRR